MSIDVGMYVLYFQYRKLEGPAEVIGTLSCGWAKILTPGGGELKLRRSCLVTLPAEEELKFIRGELTRLRAESEEERGGGGQVSGRPCRHLFPDMCAWCRTLIKRERHLTGEAYP